MISCTVNVTMYNLLLYFILFETVLSYIFISELNADTPGTDDVEFIELYNSDNVDVFLDNYYLVFYSGHLGSDPAVVYSIIDLSGHCIGAKDYFLIASTNVVPAANLLLEVNTNAIQNGGSNGADGVVLYYNEVPGMSFKLIFHIKLQIISQSQIYAVLIVLSSQVHYFPHSSF